MSEAVRQGTVNATGDRIFVDGQWQPYSQRNGVEVNILKSRLNSANEEIAALKASSVIRSSIFHDHCAGCWHFRLEHGSIVARCNECGEQRFGAFPGIAPTKAGRPVGESLSAAMRFDKPLDAYGRRWER